MTPAMPSLIDIGINLGHDSFATDRAAVIARARAAGVAQMIITGASGAGSRQALALARPIRDACLRPPACIRITPPN